MLNLKHKKAGLMLAAGLIVLALASSPARAHHGSDVVVPLVAGVALGAWWQSAHQTHSYRHGYRYKRYGYYRDGGTQHGYKRRGHHRKSHSRQGHYRKGHGHRHQQHRYSTSRGSYHGSKRRH